jgi:hypothetical protein
LNGYTLDDLEAFANQLRAILGPEKVALALSAQENEATILETLKTNNHQYAIPQQDTTKEQHVIPAEKFIQEDTKPAKKKTKKKSNGPTKRQKFPMADQRQYFRLSATIPVASPPALG